MQPTIDAGLVRRSVEGLTSAIQPQALMALQHAARSESRWRAAARNPRQFLREHGFTLPPNVELTLSSETHEGIVRRTFSWSYREDDGMQTHVRVTMDVPPSSDDP